MIPGAVITERPSDREVVFTRVIDAPRELVWKAWTELEHLHEWYGPNGFTTTTYEFELAPGGVWRFVMHGPDGTNYATRVVFREIVEPSRLVYDNSWELPGAPVDFTLIMMLAAEGAKTRLTMRLTFADAEAMKVGVERYGVLEGGAQTMERVADYMDRVS